MREQLQKFWTWFITPIKFDLEKIWDELVLTINLPVLLLFSVWLCSVYFLSGRATVFTIHGLQEIMGHFIAKLSKRFNVPPPENGAQFAGVAGQSK